MCKNTKKAYLQKYRQVTLEIERLKEEYHTLQQDIQSTKAINYDGMPHGSSKSDLSTLIARLEKQKEQINKAFTKKVEIRGEIKQAIEILENEVEKQVLYSRYINLLTWDAIANQMNYTVQHVYRLHGCALEHFEIPKKSPRASEG